jgi:hypothetical protein
VRTMAETVGVVGYVRTTTRISARTDLLSGCLSKMRTEREQSHDPTALGLPIVRESDWGGGHIEKGGKGGEAVGQCEVTD